jgi:hypothetical protein
MALVIVSACAPGFVPPVTDTGVEGYVTIGPSCPAMQAGNPCPDRPYAGTLTILVEPSGLQVAQVQADAQGYYRMELAPGHYVVHPESPGSIPHAQDLPLAVQAHQFTRLDVVYDSGIR